MSAEHVLVVEDDRVVMTILASQLQSQGYRVSRAATASEAIHATRTDAPDVMILDLTLNDEDPFSTITDGYAFLTMLRRTNPEAAFPVIVHTSEHTPRVEDRAKALGVTAVFSKDRPIAELFDLLRKVLDDDALTKQPPPPGT